MLTCTPCRSRAARTAPAYQPRAFAYQPVGTTGGGFDPKPFKLTLLQQHAARPACSGRRTQVSHSAPAASIDGPAQPDAIMGCLWLGMHPAAATRQPEESDESLGRGRPRCEPHPPLCVHYRRGVYVRRLRTMLASCEIDLAAFTAAKVAP